MWVVTQRIVQTAIAACPLWPEILPGEPVPGCRAAVFAQWDFHLLFATVFSAGGDQIHVGELGRGVVLDLVQTRRRPDRAPRYDLLQRAHGFGGVAKAGVGNTKSDAMA